MEEVKKIDVPIEEPKENLKDINNDNPVNVAFLVATRLEQKKKELEEYEQKIDKKIQDFKKFIQDTEIQGQSFAGKLVDPPELSQEELVFRGAEKLIAGTGLKLR